MGAGVEQQVGAFSTFRSTGEFDQIGVMFFFRSFMLYGGFRHVLCGAFERSFRY